ncbi:MAG: hypothetical protein J7M12_04470, partial [Candidatus Hydrogenedentes bacterium]|nr:hypothetical protein [Candidatus Hydrogenedentota bacterium]
MMWLNSDVTGMVIGVFVFLIMMGIGWAKNVPFLTSAERAVLGLLIGYLVGYFLSSRIRRAIT